MLKNKKLTIIKTIIDIIFKLALSEGAYSRLFKRLNEMPNEEFECVMKELEKEKFMDEYELVMFLNEGVKTREV